MYAPEGLSDEMASLVGDSLRKQLAREHQNSRVNQSDGVAKEAQNESHTSALGQHQARIETTSYHCWASSASILTEKCLSLISHLSYPPSKS